MILTQSVTLHYDKNHHPLWYEPNRCNMIRTQSFIMIRTQSSIMIRTQSSIMIRTQWFIMIRTQSSIMIRTQSMQYDTNPMGYDTNPMHQQQVEKGLRLFSACCRLEAKLAQASLWYEPNPIRDHPRWRVSDPLMSVVTLIRTQSQW